MLKELWFAMDQMFHPWWTRHNGESPVDENGSLTPNGRMWEGVVGNEPSDKVRQTLNGLMTDSRDFPPTIKQFRALLHPKPEVYYNTGSTLPPKYQRPQLPSHSLDKRADENSRDYAVRKVAAMRQYLKENKHANQRN